MDITVLQGIAASAIGIVLFLMGYYKGTRSGIQTAVQSMFDMGMLTIDKNNNIVAGPKLNNTNK
jgi:hypothetical protein